MEIFTILCLLTLNYFAADAYIRVERATTCPKITDFPGRVKYRRRGTRAVFKCPKKFDRHGPKFATCQKDGTWSNDPPLCIKTGCVPLDPSQVTKLDMEVVNGAFVQFSCLDGYMLIGAKQAYCDGKDWSAPLPRCAALHELSECDFEKDLCGWTQDDVEEQDWIRQMGPTQTGNTGPKHDHTLGDSGNGHYLYFETSSPSMAGHKANLLSPVYTADFSPMCFDFWYHILGPEESGHVGSLEVFILDQSQFIDDDDVQPVFIKKGNQGDTWHRGDIFIDTQPESYQIAIVATKALSYISDIAFDDVRLYNCSQSTTSTPKADTSTTTTTTSTTTSAGNITTTVEKTVTSSATPVTTITTIRTKTESPTTTTIKTETITESPTSTTKSTTITESPTPAATKTSTFKSSSSTAKPTRVSTLKQTVQPTMKPTGTTSNTSPNTNTWSSVFTKTTMITPKSTPKLSTKTTTAPTKSTEKTNTSKQKTSATSSKPTSAPTSTSTTSRTITTAPPVSSQTSSKSTVTTSFKASTATPKSEYRSTVKTTKASSGPTKTYTKTTTFSESTTESPVKTDTFTRDSTTTSTSGRVSTTSSSSFSSASHSTTSSSSSSSFSSSYSTSSESTTGGTKQHTTPPNSNTKTKVSKDSSKATKTVKPTKRKNDLTTKSPKSSNTSKDNTISVSSGRSKHPEDDTLKPLMIGLCVGIVAGLIIIGVIAYVCVRRRKFYTSRYEDELKPITNSASLQSLNNGHYYQDEEYESES